jgi:uroporphyrinogen-III synthase
VRLLITRPREDAELVAEILRRRGVEVILEPLLEVAYEDGPGLDLDGVQALLVTSANGVRAFARRDRRREVAVYAVGDASARAAAAAGFAAVESATGDVDALAGLVRSRLVPGAGALLHVAGSRVAGDLKGLLEGAGFDYRRAVLYEARTAAGFSAETEKALRRGDVDGVLLYSPRTAATFVRLAEAADLSGACAAMTAFCLSPAVAAKAGTMAWGRVVTAGRPDQEALLALLVGEG